jgi:flagellar hook-associated protein 1
MSLSSVIQIAQNSLSNMTRRTSVLARNINDSGNESYARRDLQTITLLSGAQTSSVRRSTDLRLERAAVDASSANSAQQLLAGRLATLNGILAGPGPGLSVSNKITALHDSLQTYSGAPDNTLLGEAVVSTAKEVVAGLRDATAVLQEFRTGIDKEIGQAVSDLSTLLSEFQDANNEIRQGTMLGRDVNDAFDRRGALLNDIAKIVPVSSFTRVNNDMVLLTASGATLFETGTRLVSFAPQGAMSAGSMGNQVFVDVVKLNFGNTPNSSATGSLDALLRLRDDIAPMLQKQMDEIARSLVADFAETDVTGGSLAPLQGLFAWPGGPAFPTAAFQSIPRMIQMLAAVSRDCAMAVPTAQRI